MATREKWGKNPNTLKAKLHKIKVYFLYMLKLRSKPMMESLNSFIKKNMKLSRHIDSYQSLHENPPIYDIYVSGSDQIWNPNTMLGDMSYMFDFVPMVIGKSHMHLLFLVSLFLIV